MARRANADTQEAAPTFVAGGQGAVGAQPYETLVQFLGQAGAKAKPEGGAD